MSILRSVMSAVINAHYRRRTNSKQKNKQHRVSADASAQMSETWQLASFSDYDHSLEALNCVKKQKMKNEQKYVSFINDRSV